MKKLIIYIPLLFFTWSIQAQVIEEGLLENSRPIINRLTTINSTFSETNPVITADGRNLVFTSQRGGEYYNQKIRDRFDSDIFFATRTDIDSDNWSPATRFSTLINDELDQDEPFISADGKTLTYQSWSYDWEEDGGPYYEIQLSSNANSNLTPIGQPQPLGRGITQFFIDNHLRATDGLTRTSDGSLLFVAGRRYTAPMDIYYAKRLGNGQFLPPVRLACSSSFDERSVFLSGDQTTLYFASNKPGGQGGLDIYKVAFDAANGTTDTPINIAAPYNTTADECNYVMHRPEEAFFIRDGDIHSVRNNSVSAIVIATTEPETIDIPTSLVTEEILPESSLPMELSPTQEELAIIEPTKREEILPEPSLTMELPPVQEKELAIIESIEQEETAKSAQPSILFSAINNVVFAFDVSSSMDQQDRLPLISKATLQLVPAFRERDKISMVAFSETPDIKLNGLKGSNKSLLISQINSLVVKGKANGLAALTRALELAISHRINGNNLVIMATDGKMNYKKVKALMKKYRKKGIRLIVFSYGNPDTTTRNTLNELTAITNGYHTSIHQNNVDAEMLKVLGGKLSL